MERRAYFISSAGSSTQKFATPEKGKEKRRLCHRR
jgi:hypothetical protein